MFAKNWKVFVVLGVLIWSVCTLIQFIPDTKLQELQKISAMPPPELQTNIMKRVENLPDWSKMNQFQREDAIKGLQEEAAYANNLQILGHFHNYTIATNLKLGLDLRGGS